MLRQVQVCADTVIGSQLTRGISGGQKKRVTTGARLLFRRHFVAPQAMQSMHATHA